MSVGPPLRLPGSSIQGQEAAVEELDLGTDRLATADLRFSRERRKGTYEGRLVNSATANGWDSAWVELLISGAFSRATLTSVYLEVQVDSLVYATEIVLLGNPLRIA